MRRSARPAAGLSQPKWRMATKPLGRTWSNQRRMSSSGSKGSIFHWPSALSFQGFWNGDRDQVISHRQEPGFLRRAPLLLIRRPALRTTAMIATMELIVSARAIATMMEVTAASGRAATQHGFYGAPVAGRDGTLRLRDVTRPVLAKQARELHSLRLGLKSALVR
jgi:hypothetical protein